MFPEPPELLLHLLSIQKGPDAPLEFRDRIPKGNYLYAETVFHRFFRPKFSRLSLDYVEGFGLAYLRSLGESLPRHIRRTLRTYASAIKDGDEAARPRRRIGASDGHDQWDGPSEMTLAALIALRRLEHPIDSEILTSLAAAAGSVEQEHLSLFASAAVAWAAFDAGISADAATLEHLIRSGASELTADYAMTLLKRGEEGELQRFLHEVPEIDRVAEGFTFWPLIDFMESQRLIDVYQYGHHETQKLYPYRLARAMKAAPPPWYRWRHAI